MSSAGGVGNLPSVERVGKIEGYCSQRSWSAANRLVPVDRQLWSGEAARLAGAYMAGGNKGRDQPVWEYVAAGWES